MTVRDAIDQRRAYRSLERTAITGETLQALISAASLAPSCFNNQPWRYVFVHDASALSGLSGVFSAGNEWARNASMVIAVLCDRNDDCVIKGREYYLFDSGLSAAFLILRATEMGLVAHPIAGFDEAKAKAALAIPDNFRLITLIIVGKHSSSMDPVLSDKQVSAEKERPARLPHQDIAFMNRYGG